MTVGASWKEVTLEDHVDLVVGYAFKSSGYTDDESDVRLLRGDNVAQGELRWDKAKRWPVADYQRYEAFHLREGDIILAMDRPWISAGLKYARVKRKDTPSLLVQRVARLRGTESLKTDYLRCVIGSADFTDYVLSILTGVNIPHISAKDIKRFRFLLPPVATQERISRVITSYDDLIENNTRRIEILEEMARRLYEEWFVQFRFPGHEGVKFKESELGLIPQGWQLLRLGDCVELAYGKALKAQDRVPGDYPVYGSSGVVGTHCESLVDGPGIIVGRKGNVGSVFWSDVSFFPIDTTYYVRSDVPLSYLYFNLQRQRFLNNDAAVPGLNREQAYALPFLLPDKDLLSRFSSEWESFYGLLQRLGRANVNLRAQRDLLLPKLISGEIDVSDIPMPT